MEGLPLGFWDDLSLLRAIVRREGGNKTDIKTFATQEQLNEWLRVVKMGREGTEEDQTIAVVRIAHSHGLAATFGFDGDGKMIPVSCLYKG